VGNLGLLASRQGDLGTAEICLGHHLRLTRGEEEEGEEALVGWNWMVLRCVMVLRAEAKDTCLALLFRGARRTRG
jgi:hypothetical protein